MLTSAVVLATGSERNLNVSGPDVGASKRIALVIGNATYPGVGALKNSGNDARDFGNKLKSLGFEVILRTDVKQKEMLRALTEFGGKISPGTEALFFYAGHGMQVKGRNYLIPVDAEIRQESDASSEAVDVDQLLDKLAPARLSMVILDACRNNPFERRFRGGGQGLAQINAPTGTLIAYATAPGKVAADGDGRNGLYTSELLAAMDEPGIKIEDVFKRVRANVVRKSSEAQTPWESSSLTGDFYFNPNGSIGSARQLSSPDPIRSGLNEATTSAVELAFWDAIKNSNNRDDLLAYLQKFPSGEFATLARLRLERTQPQASSKAMEPLVNILPPSAFSASSIWSNDLDGHGPANARYSSTATFSNWSADVNDINQWLQIDLQRIHVILGIGTKGRFSTFFGFAKQWVSEYVVAISTDGSNWQYLSDTDRPKVFTGNNDDDTEVRHTLPVPVRARFLRIHPKKWYGHISMRVEVYGFAEDK